MPNSQIGYRPTWAEVNLENVAWNFAQVKKLIAPQTKVMACVKADAYGHGIVPVSKKLESLGVDYLGVASIDEGITLRQAGQNLPILVMGMAFKKDAPILLRHNLTPTVSGEDLILGLKKNSAKLRGRVNIQIKVDTGMSRIGVLLKDALSFIKKISRLKFINIEGLFTHLACADLNREYTLGQINSFSHLIEELERSGIHIPLKHAANSMGVLGYAMSHFNMVRPGLMLYGLYPKKGLKVNLKPALGLRTKIVYVKRLPKGQGISYGHTYITKQPTTIVTLPIGYGDGYPRNLSNLAPALIKGKRFKVSGRVCMDQVMVDVGGVPVKAGDEAVLIGRQGRDKITTEELAYLSGTIPYEIVCGLGARIPRVYQDRF
ncbi:MAG TPA: alanine racemase [Candidatus Omnitrophota bacterium]|nr:alanine racemase [Candidatus Omnitrophota bacterium]